MGSTFDEAKKVQILSDLVKINSVNGNEEEVATYVSKVFKEHGITTKIIPIEKGRVDLIAEIGSGKPVLGVSGHMDVVDPGDLSQWDTDPFELTEKNGNLYGRGATDMKAGLAAFMISMIDIKEQNLLPKGTIRLMATVGEEVGEKGSQTFYEKGEMDNVDALVIGEPSGYSLVYAHKGSMDIKLTSKGKASHSSMPELGYNAIDPLLSALNIANEKFRGAGKKNELLGDLTFNTTIFNGGNQVNSIPESAESEINVRTIPEFDNDEVVSTMQKIVDQKNNDGAKIDMDIYMSLESVQHDDNSKLINLAKKIGEKYSKDEIPKMAVAGVTDASNLLKDKPYEFPFIVFGPGEPTMPHQVNEYVNKQVYFNFIDIYEELFVEYMK
ncbi:ArgE/DapE family deacylase [Lactobacillus sp. YT155]|uniref:ArgE/DapE family deacylase n=1 Tax=Lactobacillus sp. YT155 TaxID=3060955 RepID=UPI00266053CD|nr:ArgE/DapE family deacylase [Lactobacillus sp. YT155]MDO1605762.1 ArgE/DapE family deacylase [Lactobacillus sp. YT155]